MKERELREHAVCNLCGKKIGESGLPLFWTAQIQRHGLKLDALRRQTGLEMMLGGHVALAQIMGPDEDMTQLMSSDEITVCETCALERALPLMAMLPEEPDGTADRVLSLPGTEGSGS